MNYEKNTKLPKCDKCSFIRCSNRIIFIPCCMSFLIAYNTKTSDVLMSFVGCYGTFQCSAFYLITTGIKAYLNHHRELKQTVTKGKTNINFAIRESRI